jgi:hypothetical protein
VGLSDHAFSPISARPGDVRGDHLKDAPRQARLLSLVREEE